MVEQRFGVATGQYEMVVGSTDGVAVTTTGCPPPSTTTEMGCTLMTAEAGMMLKVRTTGVAASKEREPTCVAVTVHVPA